MALARNIHHIKNNIIRVFRLPRLESPLLYHARDVIHQSISFKLALLDRLVCVDKSNFCKYSVDKCHAIFNWENAKDDKIFF